MRPFVFAILLFSACILTTVATAQTIDAPATVQAAGDGSFTYDVRMVYPPEGAMFGGITIHATENIAEGTVWIDGFCIGRRDGESIEDFTVTGHLSNPTASGAIDFHWFCCDPAFSLSSETTILAPTVDNDSSAWSLIKKTFR